MPITLGYARRFLKELYAMSSIQSIYCSRLEAFKQPYGAVASDTEVCFRIYPRRTYAVTGATLWIGADDEKPEPISMTWEKLEGARDCYQVKYIAQKPALYWYYFTIKTAIGEIFVSHGYAGMGEPSATLREKFQLTVFDQNYQVATWFGQGITYNIFPDRFFRTEKPAQIGYRTERKIHDNWSDIPVYQPDANGEILNNDFFGGSIQGVISKLDYLKGLHVSTIYFNPIFEAYSNHRYDTGDYKKIDPMIGSEQDFRQLCIEAKRRGMRVILDGVFSHTGYDSRYFNARGHYDNVGAYQSQQSPYYDWYEFTNWPNQYSSWWGIYTLPQVNEVNENYLNYIIESKDSVIRHWLEAGASGWRLDVADELPDKFIEKLNQAAREVKPDALVVGEVWEDASNKISYGVRRKYFQGGELDSVMNYPLRDSVMAFLTGTPADQFVEKMESIRENYPQAIFYNLMNIIGTHDTPRALTVLGTDDTAWAQSREYRANLQLSEEQLIRARARMKIAATIQFTMPGSPTIYYGDEAGLQGFEDPFNRRTYPWGDEDADMLDFYRNLCALRDNSPILKQGILRFIYARDGILCYERSYENKRLLIAINRDEATSSCILPYSTLVDINTGRQVTAWYRNKLKLILGGMSVRMFECE